MRLVAPALAMFAIAIILSSCEGNQPSSGQNSAAPQSGQFTGVALPAGYDLETDKSIALGAGDRWIGRISFTSGMPLDEMFDFYRREMPKYGWVEGTVVRDQKSVITFTSSATARVAVIQITSETLGGSHVEMLVSPQTDNASDSGGAPVEPGTITSQPVHQH